MLYLCADSNNKLSRRWECGMGRTGERETRQRIGAQRFVPARSLKVPLAEGKIALGSIGTEASSAHGSKKTHSCDALGPRTNLIMSS